MPRIVAALILLFVLTACDAASTLTEGTKQARAVEADLAQSTGLKPQVGFNWANGRLRSVTVMFPRVHETKPLRELAEAVRAAVAGQFKQVPDRIVVGFLLRTDGK